MKNLAFVAGLLILAIGVIGIVEPSALAWLVPHAVTSGAFYVFGAVRIALGLVLISVASRSRAPRTLRIVGYFILVAGVATVLTGLVGMERARAIIDWWLQEGPVLVRLTGAGVAALGGFIAYVCAPCGLVGFLRGVALVAVVVGAAGSIGLMLRAGHPPLLLRILFTGWVLSPFAGLLLAEGVSKRWTTPTRAALYGLMLILAGGSLAFYARLIPMPPGSKPAFLFLVVPLGSWLLLTIAVPIAILVSRTRPGRGAGVK